MNQDNIFYSICCGAEIICHDGNGHGHCSECGDTTTPDKEGPKKYKLFDLLFWGFTGLIFLLLIMSCNPYKKLNGAPCNSLYTLPLSSPFFTTMYNQELSEIYILTDLKLADNRNHYLQHFEECDKIQVSKIERKGDNLKLTFQLTAYEFLCYMIHLNESDITYCTRNNQKL